MTGSALADSQVTMQFLGHGGTEQNPVYPWYFQVDGVPTTLICDTIHNLNVKGETWQANVTNILNGPTEGLFKGNTLIDYKAAAIIFSDILFHRANASDANWAIWARFTPSAKNSKYGSFVIANPDYPLSAVSRQPGSGHTYLSTFLCRSRLEINMGRPCLSQHGWSFETMGGSSLTGVT